MSKIIPRYLRNSLVKYIKNNVFVDDYDGLSTKKFDSIAIGEVISIERGPEDGFGGRHSDCVVWITAEIEYKTTWEDGFIDSQDGVWSCLETWESQGDGVGPWDCLEGGEE